MASPLAICNAGLWPLLSCNLEVDLVDRAQHWVGGMSGALHWFTIWTSPGFTVSTIAPLLAMIPALLGGDVGAQVLVATALAGSLNLFLKLTFRADRPFWISPALRQFEHTCESGFGFPSGHLMGFTAAVASFYLAGQDFAAVRRLGTASKAAYHVLSLVLIVASCCVSALARMVVAAHFFGQVLVGFFVGFAVAAAVRREFVRYREAAMSSATAQSSSPPSSAPSSPSKTLSASSASVVADADAAYDSTSDIVGKKLMFNESEGMPPMSRSKEFLEEGRRRGAASSGASSKRSSVESNSHLLAGSASRTYRPRPDKLATAEAAPSFASTLPVAALRRCSDALFLVCLIVPVATLTQMVVAYLFFGASPYDSYHRAMAGCQMPGGVGKTAPIPFGNIFEVTPCLLGLASTFLLYCRRSEAVRMSATVASERTGDGTPLFPVGSQAVRPATKVTAAAAGRLAWWVAGEHRRHVHVLLFCLWCVVRFGGDRSMRALGVEPLRRIVVYGGSGACAAFCLLYGRLRNRPASEAAAD